jgi:hypothetical protein
MLVGFLIIFLYLVAVFYRLGHPLREKLRDLGTMNMSRCIQGYSIVLLMDITPSESFMRHELSALLGTPLVDRYAYRKRTGWGLGYNVPASGFQGALSCDIGIC